MVNEVLPVQPFSLEPTLHVSEGHDDGIDFPGMDAIYKVFDGEITLVSQSHWTLTISPKLGQLTE
jgi:hypothetical protein